MENKDEIKAILESAVGSGVLRKKNTWIDKSTRSNVYYFPFNENAKKKERPEGQVNPP